MANTFLTHRQMGEVEAYYKIFPNLNLKYSDVSTIFIPSDKKELRSKFLQKIDEDNISFKRGVEIVGSRDGKFIEKPDIIDKFCRRELKEKNPELKALCPLQFARMYDPIRRKVDKKDEDPQDNEENVAESSKQSTEQHCINTLSDVTDVPWEDDEDRLNYYITTNRAYDHIRLPQTIKIQDPKEGEVAIFEKRSKPKVARFHKKREDTDPHRYFLSELMLYTGYTDKEELGANDEQKCKDLYFNNKDAIQYVKRHLMPFMEGIEEARFYVEEAMKEERTIENNIGNELDAEKEQEIEECLDIEEQMHPDFEHINPDEQEFENNLIIL